MEEIYIKTEGKENETVGRMEGEEEGEVHMERKTKRRREGGEEGGLRTREGRGARERQNS